MSQATDNDVAEWTELVTSGSAAYETRKTTEAELKFVAALRIAEKWASAENMSELNKDQQNVVLDRLAKSLNNMAALYHTQGKYKMAEDIYNRCLDVKINLHGEDHVEVALTLHNLAVVHSAKARWNLAEPLYKRAIEIRENQLGMNHTELVPVLNNYAQMLKKAKRDDEAQQVEARVATIASGNGTEKQR